MSRKRKIKSIKQVFEKHFARPSNKNTELMTSSKMFIANNYLTNEKILEDLAKDKKAQVRLSVSLNANTSKKVLEILSNDSNEEVKNSALRKLGRENEIIIKATRKTKKLRGEISSIELSSNKEIENLCENIDLDSLEKDLLKIFA